MNKSKKQKDKLVSSIKKTQRKTNIMLAKARKNSLYEKVKAVRPLFLKIIRLYDYLKDDLEWDKFWYVAYKKSCEFIKELDRQEKMNYFGIELTVKELNYINNFKVFKVYHLLELINWDSIITSKPSLMHGDLHFENILINNYGGKLL